MLVDRSSGAVWIEYGPAMMWNSRYGMTSGYMVRRGPGMMGGSSMTGSGGRMGSGGMMGGSAGMGGWGPMGGGFRGDPTWTPSRARAATISSD